MAQMFEREEQLVIPTPHKLLTPAVTVILALMILGFGMLSWAREIVLNYLVLYPYDVLHGRVWQLLTYSLINNGFGLIFNMLVVLFVGSAIEREWRTRSFIKLWLVSVFACALIWILLSVFFTPLRGGTFGSAPGAYGLLGAYAVLFRRQKIMVWAWVMQAQHVALLFIAVGIIMSIPAPQNLVFVAGAGITYIYVKFLWFMQKPKARAIPQSNRFKDLG